MDAGPPGKIGADKAPSVVPHPHLSSKCGLGRRGPAPHGQRGTRGGLLRRLTCKGPHLVGPELRAARRRTRPTCPPHAALPHTTDKQVGYAHMRRLIS
ncbi:putative protein without homology [Propionibacterium freudenreichii subsp. shermanii]|nr:putative protein without homology [Propionibacterium freudenreichii subsp. shermanii]